MLVAVPLLVAYGRLYRGMHHPTDVVGSYINGLACIAIAASSCLRTLGTRGGARQRIAAVGDTGADRMRRAAVVYNPVKVPDLPEMTERVERFMSENGWDAPLWLETTEDDPGIGMCERAVHDECDVVFVCGGDGTVMAAVTAMASFDVPWPSSPPAPATCWPATWISPSTTRRRRCGSASMAGRSSSTWVPLTTASSR